MSQLEMGFNWESFQNSGRLVDLPQKAWSCDSWQLRRNLVKDHWRKIKLSKRLTGHERILEALLWKLCRQYRKARHKSDWPWEDFGRFPYWNTSQTYRKASRPVCIIGLLSAVEIINGPLEDAALVCTTLISRPAAPSSASIDFRHIIITSKHIITTSKHIIITSKNILITSNHYINLQTWYIPDGQQGAHINIKVFCSIP